MAFLFLTVSLICVAIQEWIEGLVKWRAMDLERALRLLLSDIKGEEVSKLINHPMLNALFPGTYDRTNLRTSWLSPGSPLHMRLSKRQNLPSYIPAKHFSVAFLDYVVRGPSSDAPENGVIENAPLTINGLRTRAATLPFPLKRIVLYAVDYSGGDIERVKDNIENWFNGVMDRTSGWYKLRTQGLLFGLGLIIAIALNIDAIHVLHRLTIDKSVREVVMKEAEVLAASGLLVKKGTQSDRIENAKLSLYKVGMPIGWVYYKSQDNKWVSPFFLPTQLAIDDIKHPPTVLIWTDWLFPIIGWLVTAFAVMLGAPFWFDILNRFMVIRSTVKPHEKSPEESSEDSRNG